MTTTQKCLTVLCLAFFFSAVLIIAHHSHADGSLHRHCAICYASHLSCDATTASTQLYLSFIGWIGISEIHFDDACASFSVPDLRGPPA